MLFNSFHFLLLVFVTALVYYFPPLRRFQVTVLILASFVFYAYGQPYLLILLLTSATITTICSYSVLASNQLARRRLWVTGGVLVNLLVLAFFKYNRLLAETIYSDLSNISSAGELFLTLPLPIGISFYTFQGISLMIDVWRHGAMNGNSGSGERRFFQHYKETVFYITFFPQLVAGPIVKAHEFYPQIGEKRFRDISWSTVIRSLVLGYFLKMVIADNLKDQTFWIAYPYFLNKASADLVIVLGGYSMQIFADFAGYSLIAIGVARLFGYQLPKNFNYPYIAQSFSEFWRRWHISLSTWLRDYLYIPLGGSRFGGARTYLNLAIVMFLGGLWHGAAWSYAVWGGWHGLALVLERPFLRSRFYQSDFWILKGIRILMVFAFVSFAWLLFKLPDFHDVIAYVKAVFVNTGIPMAPGPIVITALFSLPVILMHLAYLARERLSRVWALVAAPVYGLLAAAIFYNSGSTQEFIYFQF